jgi:hypothetical protein
MSVSELLLQLDLPLTLSCRYCRLGSLQRESLPLPLLEAEGLWLTVMRCTLFNSTPSISTVSTDGSRRVMFALWVSSALLAPRFGLERADLASAFRRQQGALPSCLRFHRSHDTDYTSSSQEWELQKYGR